MLPADQLDRLLKEARSGADTAREEIILILKPFAARVASGICGRALIWGLDDELSVSLLAMNEAIDRYDPGRGVPFTAFARLLVRSRVTDYLRKQSRQRLGEVLSLDDQGAGGLPLVQEAGKAWEEYWERETAREREEEIREYSRFIGGFGITFADLVRCAPKHRDSRAQLLRVSRELAGNDEMFSRLMSSRKLPLQSMSLQLGVHWKTLERGRKYIIATAIIWRYCEDFLYLCTFLKPLQ